MSFNSLEVARVVQEASRELSLSAGAQVQSVELVEFPLPGKFADLNVALRLSNKRLVVFSLKSPWLGIYHTAPGLWRTSKMNWATAFGGAPDWNPYLKNQTLKRLEVTAGDRAVHCHFSNGIELRVELFPARPNWVLTAGGVESRWRSSSPPRPGGGSATGLSAREEDLYKHYKERRLAALLQGCLERGLSDLQSRLSHVLKTRAQMGQSLAEAGRAAFYRQCGESLKAVLHEYPKNSKLEQIGEIKLDSGLTLSENADRYFARYKKAQRTAKEVEARLQGIEGESQRLTSSIASLRGFKRHDDESYETAYVRLLEDLKTAGVDRQESAEITPLLKKTQKKWADSGLRRFETQEGLVAWVGRNHKENEELVIRLARGNDIWLHLKGRPGAHVIIQLASKKTPSLESLLDGATLAAYYSGVAAHDKVEVDYTFRKYVKRVAGKTDKFLVTYSQNKTLLIKIEEERLWRLLKQH